MLTVLTANSQAGGFTIANSLRFRASASAYLSRTPSVAGNQRTWTWSAWVKRGVFGQQQLFSADRSAGSEGAGIQFTSSSQIQCYAWNGSSYDYNLISSQVFRDPSAWYHIDLLFDTTQATSSNRIKIYVNGVQITAFDTSTYPAQNLSGYINSAQLHTLGRASYYSGLYFDGYLTEINFIDGQALTPSSFGEIDSTTGVWKAKRYAGTYGTNGFRLNFSNGTSTTTLGYDSSGNGNNWTTNNISLTAGSTYDWMIDSPTKFPGSSYGVGNYCTLNPLDTLSATMSNGNMQIATGTSGYGTTRATIAVSSGKWYWEASKVSGTDIGIGIIASTIPLPSWIANAGGYAYLSWNGNKQGNGGAEISYGATYGVGDVIGVALDMDGGTLEFYKNNVSQGVAFSSLSGSFTPAIADAYGNASATVNFNFGQRPFAYTPPSGYKSLCTQNLPGVTIQNGAQYMAATTYTGSGASMTISNAVNGVSFQPDFVWLKCRSSARINGLWDSVRGATKYLSSNNTDAEATDATNGVIAFLSSGYTVGATGTWNFSGDTFVGWQWKAGGTAVTNTAGSITSSVSANTTAGFSVVTYTGNGATSTQTIGHGLGTTLSMVIIKARTTGGNDNNWGVSHTSVAAPNYLILNTTNQADNWGPAQGQPSIGTGNTFKVLAGTAPGTNNFNASGVTYVAYCFAAIPGYSAFGSYTGNGSADGPFVYCGFRPRFVLIKRTDSAGYDWPMRDAARSPYNEVKNTLLANSSNAEATNNLQTDFLSNGFKLRDTGGNGNASGGTYIYAAFCEVPMNFALAR